MSECPICLEVIECGKNSITTECGHCFHASCLMTNVAHNGFDCPYCRTVMAEEPEEDDDSDDEDDAEFEEDDEFALRGFRLFMNNVEGEEHDAEDLVDEDEDEAQRQVVHPAPDWVDPKPSPAFISQKLSQQGVTMEDLVKCLLLNHDEYYEAEDIYDRMDSEIFGKLRIVISNFTPEQEPVLLEQEPVLLEPVIPVLLEPVIPVVKPIEARHRRIMYHV